MSEIALFVLGTGVTLLVGIALALLGWAAVMDGRDEREFRAGLARQGVEVVPLHMRPVLVADRTDIRKGAA